MTVNKISNAKLASIKRKSAYALPDNPTGSGMNAEKIKDAFWTFALDENDSIVAELHRIVDEANSDISAKESSTNKGVAIADNASNTVKFPTAKDVADYVQGYAEPGLTKNSAFNKNFETSTSNIKNNGTASVGSLDTVARADHVHPFSDAETFAESERIKANNASYGAIVHQKEMETYAQPLVNWDNVTNIGSLTYTNAKDFFDYFRQNYPKTFRCSYDPQTPTNFQTIFGTSSYSITYGQYFIYPVVFRGSDWAQYAFKDMAVYKIVLVGSNNKSLEVGYIYNCKPNSVETIMFSGWTNVTGSQKYPVV